MTPTLLCSPLQGFTDFRFRNAFHKYFGGIDTFFAPYIRLNGKLEVKASYERDLIPKNNYVPVIHPQVMTNDADEFIFVANYVKQFGYKELNWNLGCPYPMVTKRCMGSGLINDAERIDKILERVHAETDIIVSMKMRMGYDEPSEILDVFPVLEKYPIKNIAIHARIGKQLYKGGVDLASFKKCTESTSHKLYYNGDVTSVEGFREMEKLFPTIDHWMIGRGIIADPFLPQMIKNNTTEYPEDRFEVFSKFHDTLLDEFAQSLSGDSHVIMKMYHYWEYFANSFSNSKKALKKIKKAKNISQYEHAVKEILLDEEEYCLNNTSL